MRQSICILTNLYPPVFSGSSIHCAELAKNLVQRGMDVTVITSRLTFESPEFEIVNGVNIYRIPSIKLPKMSIALNFPWLNFSFSLHNLKKVFQILRKHQPNVLHLHNHMFDSVLYAVIAKFYFKIPLVLSVHTIIKHTNPIFDFLLHLVDRFILKHLIIKRANTIICQDYIIENYVKKTFNYQNIILIPYGITPLRKPSKKKTSELRQKYNIKTGPIILSLGHLHETRNRKELITILPRLLTVFPKLKVLIVGYVGTNSTEKLARQLGVHKNIVFAGTVPHSNISEFLEIADVEAHWFDKKHPHKTPGIAGQEAMMTGKVLISNTLENIYGEGVLRNEKNILLVDPNDSSLLFEKISEVLVDKSKRFMIEKNAQETAQKYFSWDVICRKIITIYQEASTSFVKK